MKKNKRGRKMVAAGLLMIIAALLLTVNNMQESLRADNAAAAVMADLREKIPGMQDGAAMPILVNEQGQELTDWPWDENDTPIAWPVDEKGRPLEEVEDVSGQMHQWLGQGVTTDWTTDSTGALLPWLKGNDGRFVAWPVDWHGYALTWEQICNVWEEIINVLAPRLTDLAVLPPFVIYPDMEMHVEKVDGNEYIGILEIPALDISLPIMSKWSYPKLKKAPCRYMGSVYSGDMIICGHNYVRHFGGLKKLLADDEVRFTDMEGNVFIYSVSGLEILKPTDVEKMRSGEWDLTLFTCTIGGGSRVTLRCKLERYIWSNQEVFAASQ